MAEDGKPKYAAEIWELIRLFSRLGKTVYGFFLLSVGWLLLIKAGSEVLSSADPVDGLWFPYVKRWWPVSLAWQHPSVSSLAAAGVTALFVWWLGHSRYLSYVGAFLRHFVKPLIFALCFIVPILVGLFNFCLLPVTVPLMWVVRSRRRKQYKAKWLEKWKKDATAEEREAAWTAHLSEVEKKHGKRGVDDVLIGGPWEASYFILAETCAEAARRLLRTMLSHCRLGLAPITPHSYVEEFQAAKLPLQVFARAMTRIRTELGELSLLDRIQFIELPSPVRLQQTSQASRYAWLFDTEVLLWGSYKASDERVISLNLLTRTFQSKENGRTDEFGNEYQQRFFPWEIRVDFPALSFDQDDDEEVYLVLLVAEILTLQRARQRWDEGGRQAFSDFQWLDRLSLGSRKTIQEILLRAVPRALARLGDAALPQREPMTGRQALVELTGQWLGSMLYVMDRSTFEELSNRRGRASTFEQLRTLAEACTRLDPKNAIAHYRLGALQILNTDKKGALQSFRQAGELEKQSFQVHSIGAGVAADMTEFGMRSDRELSLAVWAAHAACAINTGSEYSIREIRRMAEKTLPDKLHYVAFEEPEPLAITTIKEMLPPV